MSDQTPPPVGPRGLAIRVATQGAEAYRAGRTLLACPYGPARPFSRRAWVAGYASAELASDSRDLEQIDEELDDAAPWPGDA